MKVLLLILLLFFSCKNKDKSENKDVKNPQKTIKNADIDFNKLKLNGVLFFENKTSDCNKILGKPIETIKIVYGESCGLNWENADFETYYKGLKCEQYKDSSCIKYINFKNNPDLFVNYETLKFSNSTSLDDMKLRYPNIKSYSVFDNGTAFSLSLGDGVDDKIILIFRNDKLVEFNYSIPC